MKNNKEHTQDIQWFVNKFLDNPTKESHRKLTMATEAYLTYNLARKSAIK